ncbi:MAG: class I SAM-dependent methyltransferase [Nitrospira defluvii]|nr:class I SAM-dependent methyltransferase [Nitrospira defluvii]
MKKPMTLSPCRVCGGGHFTHHDVLWGDLIAQWDLSSSEAQYINVQQGTTCVGCGSNVRSIALADAFLRYHHSTLSLREWVHTPVARTLQTLEINEAGTLSGVLENIPGHRLVHYPEYDMMALNLESNSFDIVLHSDTFEHVSDPVKGLTECRRVLRKGGACVFTVPIIIGRLTKERQGLSASYHGHPACVDESMRVYTEFGADVWCFALSAGFVECRLVSYCYPAGLALIAVA